MNNWSPCLNWRFLIAFWLIAIVSTRAVPLDFWEAAELTEQLIFTGQLPSVPRTRAELAEYARLHLIAWPECPASSNDVYTCDAAGHITALNFTARTPPGTLAALTVNTNFHMLQHFSLRNFVGLVTGLQVAANASILVVNSTFLDAVLPIGLAFILQTPGNLTLVDVRFPRYNRFAAANFSTAPQFCRFVNVSFACPVPPFLLPCFVAGDPARIRSIGDVPCTPLVEPTTPVPYFRSTFCEGIVCHATCDPPPLRNTSDSEPCTAVEYGALAYFPATPGFSTFEFSTGRIGELMYIELQTTSVVGIVRRIELLDLIADNWTTVFRDDAPPRRSSPANPQQTFYPVRVMTNRIRLHLEQWFDRTDTLERIRLEQAPWPQAARATPRVPVCPALVVLGKRSMLDETIGDSLCIGRICQFACSNADNFTFERAVASPRALIVEGGAPQLNFTLVGATSEETRVYALPDVSEAVATVNGTGFDWSGVRRVRLVGAPAAGQALPVASEPPKRGLAGVFAKTRYRQTPAGASVVPAATSAFAGKASAPFIADGNASVAVVAAHTFVFVDGTLWQFSDNAWQRAPTSLSRIIANRDERTAPPPHRKLVAIGDTLLGVVSADSKTHDGSVDPLLVNRRALQTAIDVLDVPRAQWFENFVRHDIERNISDIDVVRWNATLFGVVDRATGLTTQIEWRPLPYARAMHRQYRLYKVPAQRGQR
jgi:hypothetical protein